MKDYSKTLRDLMSGNPRSTNVVNVFSKIFGYFSKELSIGERKHFLTTLDTYRQGTASITTLREIMKIWSIRFEEDYIKDQTLFQPFPEELNTICEATRYREKPRKKG